MNKKLIVATIVGILMVLVAGSAFAQDGGQGGDGGLGGRGGRGGNHMGGIREISQIVLDATGLTRLELMTELQSGKTLAEVITENDGDVEAVKTEVITTVTENVTARVTDGSLTQERADTILAELPTQIDDVLNSVNPIRDGLGDFGGRGGRGMQLANAVAEATGLEATAVKEAVDGGKTLSEVLTENNVDVDQFVTDTLATMEERLAQSVTDGEITQEIADARLNLARLELVDRLNNNRTPKQ